VAFATWIPYIVYRMGGARWESPDDVNRLFMLVVMLVSLGAVIGMEPLLHWHTAVVLAWALLKSRRHALKVWREAHFLPDREAPRAAERTALERPRPAVVGLRLGNQH
jgi:hypothetical protein